MANSSHTRQPVQVVARVVGLLIGCLIIFIILFSLQSWREEKARAVEVLSNLMELESQAIDGYFTRLENDLRVFADDLGDLSSSEALAHGFLVIQRFKELRPEFFNITVMHADGQILFTAKHPPASDLPTLSHEPSFLKFQEESDNNHNMNIGRPLLSVISKQWIIPVRYQLRDAGGKPHHIISINLPLTFLQENWKDAPFTKKASLGLMRDDGFLVSRHPVPAHLDLSSIYGQPRTGKLIHVLREQHFPHQGYVEGPSSLDGPDFLTSYLRLEHFPVTLFIALPVAEIRSAWLNKVRMSYALTVAMLIAGTAFCYFTFKQQRIREKEQLALSMALEESETFVRNVLDSLPVHVAVIDNTGTILSVNEAWKNFARDNDDSQGNVHIGENYLAICEKAMAHAPDSYATKALEGIKSIIAGSIPLFSLEYPCHGPIIRRWFVMRALRMNSTRGLVLIMHDNITDHFLAEEAIRKSSEVYRSMFTRSNAVHLLIDPESAAIVDANPSACEYYGYNRDRLLSMRITDINIFSTQQVLAEMAMAKKEKRGYFLFKHRLATEEIRDVEVHSSPLEIEGRTLLYSIIHDITDRLQAERDIVESKREYGELVARVPVGIFRLRMKPTGLPTFEYVSPRFCELMQLSGEAVLADAQVAYARIHPDDLPGLLGADDAAQKHLGHFSWQGRVVIDDQTRFMQFESTPRKLENGDILWTGMIADITQRKHAEEMQQQLAKAESLARMAGAVAHHFNNKLMAIMGNLDMALEDIEHNDQDAAHNIRVSQKAAEQAAEVSTLMLTYLGQGIMQLSALDLCKV